MPLWVFKVIIAGIVLVMFAWQEANPCIDFYGNPNMQCDIILPPGSPPPEWVCSDAWC